MVFLPGSLQPSCMFLHGDQWFLGISLSLHHLQGWAVCYPCLYPANRKLSALCPLLYNLLEYNRGTDNFLWKDHKSPVISLLHLSTDLAWYLLVTESPHQCKQFPAFAAAVKAPKSQMFVFPITANPAAFFPHFGTQSWTNLLSKQLKSALLSPCLRGSHFLPTAQSSSATPGSFPFDVQQQQHWKSQICPSGLWRWLGKVKICYTGCDSKIHLS